MKTVKDLCKIPYSHSELQIALSNILRANEKGDTTEKFNRNLSNDTIQRLKEYGVKIANGEDSKGKFAIAEW